jgi:hypothetical protein
MFLLEEVPIIVNVDQQAVVEAIQQAAVMAKALVSGIGGIIAGMLVVSVVRRR